MQQPENPPCLRPRSGRPGRGECVPAGRPGWGLRRPPPAAAPLLCGPSDRPSRAQSDLPGPQRTDRHLGAQTTQRLFSGSEITSGGRGGATWRAISRAGGDSDPWTAAALQRCCDPRTQPASAPCGPACHWCSYRRRVSAATPQPGNERKMWGKYEVKQFIIVLWCTPPNPPHSHVPSSE